MFSFSGLRPDTCVALGPPARFLRFAFDGEGRAPFFEACRRYARALEEGALLPTQVPGGPFSLAKFDDPPLRRLAVAAALIKAGFDPDQPRDEDGRWTREGDTNSDLIIPVRMTLPAEEPSILENPSKATPGFLSTFARRAGALFAALGYFFAPSGGSAVRDGTIDGHPDLSFRWDTNEGRLRIYRTDENGTHIIFDGTPDGFGIFRDEGGRAVARKLEDGVVIDPDVLPGAEPRPPGDRDEPNLCPDPRKDRPGARAKDIAYQQWVGSLINGIPLPAGLAYRLFNPFTGDFVYYDECRWSDGTMIEAKGTNFSWIISLGSGTKPFDGNQAKFLNQANRQLQAAGIRHLEWHVAEQDVADYLRALFTRNKLDITVIHTPAPRSHYE